MIYLFTGQPGSGKTTLAEALIKDCADTCLHLDGDELRHFFNNKDYTKEGRSNNVEIVFGMVAFISYKNFTPVVSMVSPFREYREKLKAKYPVTEIYVHTSETRGREHYFADYYEKPETDFIDIDTTNKTIEECLALIPYNKK